MEMTKTNREEYCFRWGIELDLHKYNSQTSVTIQRTQCIIDALKRCEWLWFLGVDTCITNHTIDVRQLIASFGDVDCIASDDTWGLNNDSMFFRNCEVSFRFLEAVLTMTGKMTDQAAMMQLFKTTPEFRVKRVNHKLFNAYPHRKTYPDPGYWDVGDFVAHYPGLPNSLRLELIPQQLAQVIR
jgi:hypothetical protein